MKPFLLFSVSLILVLSAQSCTDPSLQSALNLADRQNKTSEDNTAVFGEPAQEWNGGACTLGALKVIAIDESTGKELSGVTLSLEGDSFDGQSLQTMQLSTPVTFPKNIVPQSQPRRYTLQVILPPTYVRAMPERALVNYDCVNAQAQFVEFRLSRTPS